MIGHHVPYIPCQAHRTNTALEHCCQASFIVAETFNILEELYVFFNSSTKRFQALKDKIAGIENAILIKNLSKTRWTARAETLKAVSISFEAILECLETISKDHTIDNKGKAKALGLYKRMLSCDFIVCLMFLKNIFYKIKIITEILEKDDLNIVDAINIISSTTNSIRNIRNSDENVDNFIKSATQFAIKLGIDPESDFRKHHRRRLTPKKFDENRENSADISYLQFYRKEFYSLLDCLINFLDDNVSSVLQNASPLTNLFSFPLCTKNLHLHEIEKALLLFPPNQRLDELSLQAELEILFDIFVRKKDDIKSLQDLMIVSLEHKNVLPSAFKLCRLVFTAGYSVATHERFSLLKFIKSATRSNMGEERLDSLMAMKSEKDLLDNLN